MRARSRRIQSRWGLFPGVEPVLINDIRIMAGKNGSIQGPAEEKWGYTTLSVANWDNDGKKDIIVNTIFGKIIWYKNTGDLVNLESLYSVKVDWGGKPLKPVWNWLRNGGQLRLPQTGTMTGFAT